MSATLGGQALEVDVPLGTPTFPPSHTFGIDVSPSLSGVLQMTLTAIDSGGTTVMATGTAMMQITVGDTTNVDVTLSSGAAPDMRHERAARSLEHRCSPRGHDAAGGLRRLRRRDPAARV